MRGSRYFGAPVSVRRRLSAAVVGAAVALPVFVPAVAHGAAPEARRVLAPFALPSLVHMSAPATVKHVSASAPAPAASGRVRFVFGHKLA